jgi:hypothetical protein
MTRSLKQTRARRKAVADRRAKNSTAFYVIIHRLEREILALGDKARRPRKGDLDVRFTLDEVGQRKLSEAAFALRRLRDDR